MDADALNEDDNNRSLSLKPLIPTMRWFRCHDAGRNILQTVQHPNIILPDGVELLSYCVHRLRPASPPMRTSRQQSCTMTYAEAVCGGHRAVCESTDGFHRTVYLHRLGWRTADRNRSMSQSTDAAAARRSFMQTTALLHLRQDAAPRSCDAARQHHAGIAKESTAHG